MTEDNAVKIIVTLITLLGTVLGLIVGYIGRTKKQAVLEAKREQEQSDLFKRLFNEIEGVKKRLDKHNKYAEKFGEIEKSIIGIQKDIEHIRKEST